MTLLLTTAGSLLLAACSYTLGYRHKQRKLIRLLLRLDSDAARDELNLPRRAA